MIKTITELPADINNRGDMTDYISDYTDVYYYGDYAQCDVDWDGFWESVDDWSLQGLIDVYLWIFNKETAKAEEKAKAEAEEKAKETTK